MFNSLVIFVTQTILYFMCVFVFTIQFNSHQKEEWAQYRLGEVVVYHGLEVALYTYFEYIVHEGVCVTFKDFH